MNTKVKIESTFNAQAETKRISRILTENAREFEKQAQAGNPSPSGKVYRRKGRPHRASARGEQIARDSGNAARHTRNRYLSPFHNVVETTTDYVDALEKKLGRQVHPDKEKAQAKLTKELNGI